MTADTFTPVLSDLQGFLLDSRSGQLFVLLLAGHVLGDFVFQNSRMVDAKRSSVRSCLVHASQVTLWHAIACIPFLFSLTGYLLVLSLGAVHFAIDRGKAVLELKSEPGMRWFVLDQALHGLSLLLAWKLWTGVGVSPGFAEDDLRTIAVVAVVVTVYGANFNGGSAIVSHVLRWLRTGPAGGDASEPSAGRIIGILERMMIVTLVWQGQWSAVGMVIAAKSVARFKELDKRPFAEIYIVGTLTSALVAMAGGIALGAFLGS